MKKQSRELFACALWVAAVALMAFGSLDSTRAGHISPFLAWGVFVGVIACMPTVWCIVHRESELDGTSVERIIEVVDALHRGEREVSRLH